MVAFGPYRPDVAKTTPGVSSRIIGCVPQLGAGNRIEYGPMPKLVALPTSTALPGDPAGGISTVDQNGTYAVFIGTTSNVYQISATGVPTSIGSGYAVPGDAVWAFQQFGDALVMSNTVDGMLEYDLVSGGSITSVSNAPKVRYLFSAFGCLFGLQCDGDNRLMRNSAQGDHTEWTPNVNGSGYQAFKSGEELVAGAPLGDDVAIVFQRNAINRLVRTGNRTIYRRDLMAESSGAVGARSVVPTKEQIFYIDSDGFYRITKGGGIEAIGAEKVNRTFFDNVDAGSLATIEGTADPSRQQVIWRYRAVDVSSATVFQNAIAYNWRLGEFVELEQNTTALFEMASPGYTLEDLDAFGDLDSLPYSLDSAYWAGGEPRIAGLDENLKFGFFDGGNMAAILETNVSVNPKSVMVNRCTPITDAENATVQLGVSDNQYTDLTFKPAASIESSGRAAVRGRGKCIGWRLNIPADETWDYASGIEYPKSNTGGDR